METHEILQKIKERLENLESAMSRFSQIDYFIADLTDKVSIRNIAFRETLANISQPVYVDSGSIINPKAQPFMEFDSGNWLTGKYYRFTEDSKIVTYNSYTLMDSMSMKTNRIFLDPPFWVPYCENHDRYIWWAELTKLNESYNIEIKKLYDKYLDFISPDSNFNSKGEIPWTLSLESFVTITKAKYFKNFS